MEIVIDISMNGDDSIWLYAERRNRTRYMRSLCEQIKRDHSYCIALWDKFEKGTITKLEEKEFLKVLSWLGNGINTFNRLQQVGIEGVLWGNLEHIKRDLKIMGKA